MPSFFVKEVSNGLYSEFEGEREKDVGKRLGRASLCMLVVIIFMTAALADRKYFVALFFFFVGGLIAFVLFIRGNNPNDHIWRSSLLLDASQGKCIITRTARSPRFDSSQAFDVDDITGFEAREENLGTSHTLHVSSNAWSARGSGYTTYHKQTRGFIVLNSNVAIPINCTSYLSAENLHVVLSSFNKALNNARNKNESCYSYSKTAVLDVVSV
ncbi:hypothetical protein RCL1_006501 [Eukaryota sp. TZLM3-RCL]